MNSSQAEKLAQILDSLESVGCNNIKVETFEDRENAVHVKLTFTIPA